MSAACCSSTVGVSSWTSFWALSRYSDRPVGVCWPDRSSARGRLHHRGRDCSVRAAGRGSRRPFRRQKFWGDWTRFDSDRMLEKSRSARRRFPWRHCSGSPVSRLRPSVNRSSARNRVAVLLVALSLQACGSDCGSHNGVPVGDRFRVEVVAKLEGDQPCPWVPLEPGDSFIVTAGSVVKYSTDHGAKCEGQQMQDIPDGLGTELSLQDCVFPPSFSMSCAVDVPECPAAYPAGTLQINLRAAMLDSVNATDEEGELEVFGAAHCQDYSYNCKSRYRVSVQRLAE